MMSTKVQSTMQAKLNKVAGPGAGTDDDDINHNNSAFSRKREKAQEQLRNRMRNRIKGTGSNSLLLPKSLGNVGRVGSLSAGMKPSSSSSMMVTPGHLLDSSYMNWQEGHEPSKQSSNMSPSWIEKKGEVPIQELVNRVLHRRDQNFSLGTKKSPMTVRAYKAPAPYVLRQNSHLKKFSGLKSAQRHMSHTKDPLFLVLQKQGNKHNESRTRQFKASDTSINSSSITGSIQPESKEEVNSFARGVNRVLPPVDYSTSKDTTKSETERIGYKLDNASESSAGSARTVNAPSKRIGTAVRRGRVKSAAQRVSGTQTTHKELTMKSVNPLPPIHAVSINAASTVNTRSKAPTGSRTTPLMTGNIAFSRGRRRRAVRSVPRATSKTEILNLKRVQELQLVDSQPDDTLLGTRQRFTNKTKRFKDELERARQMDSIQEDLRHDVGD